MKVGIVVPFSWSFWGAVTEHAELQAEALRRLGVETQTIIGNDPPGSFTRLLHPRLGRHDEAPADVIPVGRTVIVPANGSLANIALSPPVVRRIRRALERERFDVLHAAGPGRGRPPARGRALLLGPDRHSPRRNLRPRLGSTAGRRARPPGGGMRDAAFALGRREAA